MGKVWSKPGSDFQRVSQRMYQYLIPQATNCSPQFIPNVPVSYQLAFAVTVKIVPVWMIYGSFSFEDQVKLDLLELESSPCKDNTMSKTHGHQEDWYS